MRLPRPPFDPPPMEHIEAPATPERTRPLVARSGKPPTIGKYHTTASGVRCVALIPSVVITLLDDPCITSTRALAAALGDAVVRSKRCSTTPVRFGKDVVRCILVRRDAWDEA